VHRTCLALLASLVLLLSAAPALAVTVVLVQVARPTPEMTEVLSRLHGELLSIGIGVRRLERPAVPAAGASVSRAWLDELATLGGIDAVIEVVGDEAPSAVEVWVLEPSSRSWEATRVTVEPDARHAQERLAIRAAELVRALLLEHDMTARERYGEPLAEPAPPPPPEVAPDEPATRPERIGVELGALVLTSLDGVGPALVPLVRLDWAAHSRLVVQATLAGLGSRPTVATTAGHARIAQQFGVLGGSVRLGSERKWWPFVALASGTLHTAVEGEAESPRQGQRADSWSFLVDGSLGLGTRLPERYSVAVAAHVQVAEPYVAIHFADSVVATTGRPNLAFTLAVGAWP
jgi:hypothetical protein